MCSKPIPNKTELHRVFDYDGQHLIWRHRTDVGNPSWNTKYAGKIAGVKRTDCWRTQLHKIDYQMHRIIWAYHYEDPGVFVIDHINRDPHDNRLENLRLATIQQNQFNRKKNNVYLGQPSRNPYKGISWNGKNWQASIKCNRKNYRLGTFDTPEEGALAYNNAAKELFGDFAYFNSER